MASKTYLQHYANGASQIVRRAKPQGRGKSSDPKEGVTLRLYRSIRGRIAKTGISERAFIEIAVYEKLNSCSTEIV